MHCPLVSVLGCGTEGIGEAPRFLFCVVFVFEIVSYYIAQVVLELAVLTSLPYKRWDDRHELPHSAVTWRALAATQRVMATGLGSAGRGSMSPGHPHT